MIKFPKSIFVAIHTYDWIEVLELEQVLSFPAPEVEYPNRCLLLFLKVFKDSADLDLFDVIYELSHSPIFISSFVFKIEVTRSITQQIEVYIIENICQYITGYFNAIPSSIIAFVISHSDKNPLILSGVVIKLTNFAR